MGVTEILCSFQLVLEGKTGIEIPESSRLEFIEKFSANMMATLAFHLFHATCLVLYLLEQSENQNCFLIFSGGIERHQWYEIRKPQGFLIFSGGIEKEHRTVMG